MRIESSVTSVSWIPSEAVTGMTKLPFEVGVTHYDNPPPDVIDDLEGLGPPTGSASRTGCAGGSKSTAARPSTTATPAAR